MAKMGSGRQWLLACHAVQQASWQMLFALPSGGSWAPSSVFCLALLRSPNEPPLLCGRLANRLRAVLPEDQRSSLEQALAALAPMFDLKSTHPADASSAVADVPPATQTAIAAGHSMIEELAAAGCERADALAQAAADGAAQLVAAPPASVALPSADADAGAAPAGSEAAAAGGQEAPTSGPAAASGTTPAAAKALAGLHADGVRSVAELCALCLERLLALGRSLSAFYRYGKPADDHITWPTSCKAVGLLLRAQALRMLEDLQAMAAAYGAALGTAGGLALLFEEWANECECALLAGVLPLQSQLGHGKWESACHVVAAEGTCAQYIARLALWNSELTIL